ALTAPIGLAPANSRPSAHGGDEVADGFGGALAEQGLDPAAVIGKTVVDDDVERTLQEHGLDPVAVIGNTLVDLSQLTFHRAPVHLLTAGRTLRGDPALRYELRLG
ncbi:hypothetical protein UK12_34840, partial [Saccharothrix sp. ST-888]